MKNLINLLNFKFSPDSAPPIPKRRKKSPPSRFRRGRIGAPLASQETLSHSLNSSFNISDIVFFDDHSSGGQKEIVDDSDDDTSCPQFDRPRQKIPASAILHPPPSPPPSPSLIRPGRQSVWSSFYFVFVQVMNESLSTDFGAIFCNLVLK